MALLGNLLGQIACEKLPTDYDRAAKAEEQEYVPGVVRSALAWPLLDYDEHDDDAKDNKDDDATSKNDDHIGRKQATLLALYGLLMKRYMREPEIELAMVLDDGAWVGVPLHGIAGLEVSIVEAARQIRVLLRDRVPLDSFASVAGSATDDGGLSTQAFVVRDNVLLPPPREWPQLSFMSPPPPFQADVCLILEQDQFFTFVYNERLFSSTMMEAMMRCWETLLAHARQDMSVRQDLVPVVSPVDIQRMVGEWNQTETLFLPARQGIHELFEARVDEASSRLAVVGPVSGAESDIDHYPTRVQELSYGELERQANRLAHHLRRQGVQNQDIVGIFLERSVAFYVAMLGVLKAGGAYVSIDTDYPDDRIQFMLEDSGAVALVTTQVLALRVQGKTASPQRPFCLVLLDDPKHLAALAQEPTTRPPPLTMSNAIETPCYVIYTSGSTGRPKGVQISHANALNLIQAEAHIYGMQPSDRVLQGFSTSFDASVEEIWMALHNGAALVVGTKELMRSGPDFPRYLEVLRVTCLSTVPTLLATLGAVEDGQDSDDGQARLLPNVRLIITGGEACSKELMARWATNGRRFFNTYGPTEATVIATYKEYGATVASTNSVHRITIGRPLPNYQCYVLDEYLNLLPPGALGELVIGGVSVSRVGYLNLPDKTRSMFKPDPFRPVKSDDYPLYQSGDLARISLARDTMGEIEYHGRTDAQVKIRGYRVEPSEIEAVLCGLPGIQSAVVDVQQQGPGTMKQLVAFVVLAGDKGTLSLDTAAVMQAMREKLPVFMIPSHIEPMVDFPTLPSGKLDRRRLPQVLRPASRRAFSKSLTRSLSRALGAGGDIAAASACGDALMEEHNEHRRAVTGAFEQVLGLPAKTLTSPKATDADFFDLGGNSLLVSMLVTKLRRQYPAVAARDVYSHSTVGALADVLKFLDTTAASAAAAATAAVNKEGDASCTTKLTGDRIHALELERQPPASPSVYIPRLSTTILADLVQLAAMYVVAAYMGLNGLSMYLLYFNYKDLPTLKLLALLAGVSVALIPLAFLVLVTTKWLVLGRVREGDYPLWQSYHLRFWFVQCLDSVFRLFYMASLEGTPLAAWYHWAMGARIGRGVYLQGNLEGYDLVTIGDGCSLNCQANVSAVSIEGNYLKLRKVTLGRGVTLGVRAMVQPDVHMNDHCKIEALSLVPSATHVPSRQIWAGAPIAFVGFRQDTGSVATGTSAMVGALQITWSVLEKAMEAVFLVPFLYLLRAAPVPSVTEDDPVTTRRHEAGPTLLHVIWLSMVLQIGLFIASTCLVAGLKRLLLLGGLKEATTYPLTSWSFFRRWAVDNLMDSLAVYTKQLRGSLYLPLWYRLMGARMGHHAEISAFENVCAERLTLGNQVFVADDVMLGMPHVEDGVVTQRSVSIGDRTFVGNNSVVEGSTHLPHDVLVGVLTLPPSQTTGATTAPGETLLGSPPFRIQKRAELSRQAKSTYNPPSWMVFVRYVVEGVGFLLLQLSLATCFALLYVSMTWCYNGDNSRTSLVTYLLTLPLFVIGEAVVAAILTLFWKWVVIGRYRAGVYPLYGTYVWRTEFVERIEENLLHTYTYPLISGTVWMQLVNQAMGVQMGRRAYLEFPYFCEPDLCTVGDYCNMERTASLQAHLFQDRVRTTGPVKVGDFCSLGSDSVVLLGAVLGDHCALSSMSLVLRSEELPSHTQWHGLPAVKLLPGVGAAPKYDEEEARGPGGVAVEAAGRLGGAE